jgi:pilus assembly protein CpaF
MGLFTKTSPVPASTPDGSDAAAFPRLADEELVRSLPQSREAGDAKPPAEPAVESTPPTEEEVAAKTKADAFKPSNLVKAAVTDPAAGRAKLVQNDDRSAARFASLKSAIHQQLVDRLDMGTLTKMKPEQVRSEVRQLVREMAAGQKGLISSGEQDRLVEEILDETFGFGPLEAILKDPHVSDILINRHDQIYVERKGRLSVSETVFRDERHLRQVIDRIVAGVGRRVDETQPMVDARLPDGSRVNAIIPPLALDGSSVSIRRFGSKPLQLEDLLRYEAFPAVVMDFLSAAVQARCNVLISGGTGSGKTTLLNCLSRYIGLGERVITCEDAAELQLQQPHVVRLETRPANIEGKGEVTARDLVKNCLRMRPDRIIIGETRGSEAIDMLQAMNTGHDGSMTTVHANTPRDALARLEVLVAMAGYDIPPRGLRQQISSAVNIVVQASRLAGGKRKVTYVSEIDGMEGDTIQMQNLFTFEQSGVDIDGNAEGHFMCHGIRPKALQRIEHRGIKLPSDMFEQRRLG